MGFPVNSPNDDYRVASMGQDNPATEITPAHWYSGLPSAIGTGAVGGLAAVARTLSDIVNPYEPQQAITPDMSADEADFWKSKNDANKPVFADQIRDVQEWAKSDPRTTGAPGQVAGATARGLTIFGLGSLLGSPAVGASALAATEGYNDYADSTEAGIDHATALKKAGLTATVAGLGAYLPMKVSSSVAMRLAGIGLDAEVAGNQALASVFYRSAQAAGAMTSFAGRLATGAVVNTGFGMANRYATSHLLESAGYPDMANQYKALDSDAISADVVLGLAFGGWGHMEEKLNALHRPDSNTVDAAMEARKAEMTARGAGGLPTDMATAGLDASLQERALSDLIRGKSPDIQPEEAAAIVHGSVVDPERIQLHDDWSRANEIVHGPLADFSDAPRTEPVPIEPKFDIENKTSYQGQRMGDLLGPADEMLVARGEGGKDIGRLWVTKTATGFEVRKVEVQPSAQRQGVATELYLKARSAFGPWEGSTEQTPQGKALVDNLKTAHPEIFGEAKTSARQPSEPAISPLADEHMRQLAARNPDLSVTLPDGTQAKASDMPGRFEENMASAGKDSELFKTAVGCLMRTML